MAERDNLFAFDRSNRPGRHVALKASPPLILASGFIILILLGSVLLALPAAGAASRSIGTFNAFFMATSAVTVTGLSVIDTVHALSGFGKVVLLVLVQLGGLGFVTFAILTALAMGRKLSLHEQALALEAFNQTSVSRIRRTAVIVVKTTLLIEVCAALILAVWWSRELPFGTALKQGIFHAITAFNNSGFSWFEDSLAPYAGDAIIILVITSVIILGGIGFSVLHDTLQKRQWQRLSPYTRVIILATLALNLFGFIIIWTLESSNPATLGTMSVSDQALAAWMQSVTARTAGFTSIDITQLHDSTTLILIMLMFIGGGSLSTASGIKVGTFVVLLAAMWSFIRQRRDVQLMKRRIAPETVQKALALVMVTTLFAFGAVFLLTLFEQRPFIDLLFETISALSTTGMSRNLTPELSTASKIVLIVVMFAGRIGPLTLVYSLATRQHSRVRYPAAEFPVG